MAAENRPGGVGVGEEGWRWGSRRPPGGKVFTASGGEPGGVGESAQGGDREGVDLEC